MADTNLVTAPDFTGTVDQSFFLAPLGGPTDPINYLDRFPEEVYTKAIDSRLVRFMYVLLGPAGIGWLRKNYLQARLILEDYGIETFDLDAFYGDPLAFGRILEEVYDQDPSGLLPRDQWEEIRTKDASYRNRAIDFMNAARAGSTPLGMRLAARSGLGHEVEIIENYRWVYDQITDDRLGIPYHGSTKSTDEFIVLPRQELAQNEVQVLNTSGNPQGGTYKLYLPLGNESEWTTGDIAYDAHRSVVQSFLEALPISTGDVVVEGGPMPTTPLTIMFQGNFSNKDMPQLQVIPSLTPSGASMFVTTQQDGHPSSEEIVTIAPRDQYHLKTALERLKPVATFVTFGRSGGTTSAQVWNSTVATSQYHEVVRYAKGNVSVVWPKRDNVHWIEAAVEHEAPRAQGDLSYHYQGFHNVPVVTAYTDDGARTSDYPTDNWLDIYSIYKSEHLGPFSAYQQVLYPVLAAPAPVDLLYTADRVLADYAEPLTVTGSSSSPDSPVALVNGIYPTDYQNLPGVPQIRYKDDQFWASLERISGTAEYLELDLGSPQAVNYLYFEMIDKPVEISVDFDTLDLAPERNFTPVTLSNDLPSTTSVGYRPMAENPWETIEVHFNDAQGEMIYTRFLRIKFTRRASDLFTRDDGSLIPFSIEARNLRVGRNVS